MLQRGTVFIIRSYHSGYTVSHPNCEVKHCWAQSVLRWGTTRESWVSNVFFPKLFPISGPKCPKNSLILSFDHTTVDIPYPIRTAKSSTVGPNQYCGGGPRGNLGCRMFFKKSLNFFCCFLVFFGCCFCLLLFLGNFFIFALFLNFFQETNFYCCF